MKNRLKYFLIFILLLLVSGCIISESPDTDKTLIMKPGDTQQFQVVATALPYASSGPVNYQWHPEGVIQNDILRNSATFSPTRQEIGEITVHCIASSYNWDTGDLLFEEERTWKVDVWGITVLPDRESITIEPGETEIFEVTGIFPDGDYSYKWYVNDAPVPEETSAKFTFTPDETQKYTIRVNVSKAGADYSYSWRVYAGSTEWPFWGGNLNNTHYVEKETKVGRDNVGKLAPQWIFETNGSVSAIPTTVDHILYFPDWGKFTVPYTPGKIYAVHRDTGEEIWSRSITEYNGGNGGNNVSRCSPAIYKDTIIFGDVVNPYSVVMGNKPQGPTLYCVNRFNGDLIWSTKIDDHVMAQATQSPVVSDGVVYVGVSSYENVFVGLGIGEIRLTTECCNFRGNMMAIDAETGQLLWKTYTTPDNGGALDQFSGASVWGSSPVIDKKRNRVYLGTGQNYKVPHAYMDCLQAAGKIENEEERVNATALCHETHNPPDNYFDSVLAMNLDTGKIEWAFRTLEYDPWTLACGGVPGAFPGLPAYSPQCPEPTGPDYDFAQAPMLFTTPSGRELLGIGQKSGVFWAIDPHDGSLVWKTVVGPGGYVGGHMFGAATDGRRIYVQTTNLDHNILSLVDGAVTNGGYWSALDAETGAIIWQTPDPSALLPLEGAIFNLAMGGGLGLGYFATPQGPITLANGVVYAGSMDLEGHMYAMNSDTGKILWNFASGGSVNSAPTIIDGVLYWGSGYRNGTDNNKVYAFSIPEERAPF